MLTPKQSRKFYLAALVLLAITSEIILRAPLTNLSLRLILHLNQNSFKTTKGFFWLISLFGAEKIIFSIIFFVFLTKPLNASYNLFKIYCYSKYSTNILKMILTSPRPFWLDHALASNCKGGYGAPSGHSFGATVFYLSLSHYMIQDEKEQNLKIAYGSGTVLLLSMIYFSRIYLGAHTIDQVLFGCSLGILMYYYFFHIKNKGKILEDNEFIDKINHKKDTSLFLFLSGLFFLSFFAFHFFYNPEKNTMFISAMKKFHCSNIIFPSEKALSGTFYIFGIIGAYQGVKQALPTSKRVNQYMPDCMRDQSRKKINSILVMALFWISILIISSIKIPKMIRTPLLTFSTGFFLFGTLTAFNYIIYDKIPSLPPLIKESIDEEEKALIN